MYKDEILEANPIVITALNALLEWSPSRGRRGADLRAKAGIIKVNVDHLLADNTLGKWLDELFTLAVDEGISIERVDNIRRTIELSHKPLSVGAILIKDSIIQLLLVIQARIIADTSFRSRQDVEELQERINEAFSEASEAVADRMDQMTYRAIVALHAAITFYLIELARPRPRMMTYRFNRPMTTLTIAYRLYADASRGDEIRYENKIIHPLFTPRIGRALAG